MPHGFSIRFLVLGWFLAGFGLVVTPVAAQTRIYVDADASAPGTGTSWSSAYPALQDAFDEAHDHPGTTYEIWIAEGTYYPDGDHVDNDGSGGTEHTDDVRMESFTLLHDGRSLYGGFAGTETSRSARDPVAHVTILSGDLKQDDSGSSGRSDNAHQVLFLAGEVTNGTAITGATVIDGVTVTAGSANGFSAKTGGGLHCRAEYTADAECSPTLRNVTFLDNTAEAYGGGAYFVARDTGAVRPAITNTVFANNKAQYGGGMAVRHPGDQSTAEPTLTNVTFWGNSARFGGGAFSNDAGSGTGNVADPSFTNVTFANNTSDLDGGAIHNDGFSQSADPTFTNVILWGNTADANSDGNGSGDEIYSLGSSAEPTVQYSVVEGGTSGIVTAHGSSVSYDGSTSLNQDPQFVDATDGNGPDDVWATSDDGLDLRGAAYSTSSPAIDAGNDGAVPSGIHSDIADRSRTYDGDGDGTGTVDMGAYEYSGTPLPVEVTSFDATQSGESAVELSWTTASETNNAGFRVQHRRVREGERGSAGMGAWAKVGFVEGSGTTTEVQSYRWTDDDLVIGTHQFRLVQVDVDGTTTVHDPISVDVGMTGPVTMSAPAPNPVRQQATLSFAVKEPRETRIALYNVLGRKVRTLYRGIPAPADVQSIDLSSGDLSSGTYFIRLQSGDNVVTRRLTIIH